MTFAHDGLTDADFRDMESEPETITPQQAINRYLGRIRRDLNYIYENCEITDEPEDLDNYQGHRTGQHVSPAEVEALEKLETKALVCAMFWSLKEQEEGEL